MVHSPMLSNHKFMSLSTGIVGGSRIKCDSSAEVETTAMYHILGKTFADIHLHIKDLVIPLPNVTNSIKVREELIPVDTCS